MERRHTLAQVTTLVSDAVTDAENELFAFLRTCNKSESLDTLDKLHALDLVHKHIRIKIEGETPDE